MEIQTLFEYETAGIYGHSNTGNRSDLDPISRRPKINLRKELDNTSRWQTKRPLATRMANKASPCHHLKNEGQMALPFGKCELYLVWDINECSLFYLPLFNECVVDSTVGIDVVKNDVSVVKVLAECTCAAFDPFIIPYIDYDARIQ